MKALAKYSALLILAAFAAAGTANAQSDSWACNNELIRGVYGFTIEGTKLGGPGPIGPMVGVALTEFDGMGGLKQIDTVIANGTELSNFSHTVAKGTYAVNADCSGNFHIVFTDGRPDVFTNFVVVDNGNEIDTVVLPPPGAAAGPLATRSIGKRRFRPF